MTSATGIASLNPRFSYSPVVETKATPYGLPIVDKCNGCPLRKEGFFCNLSAESMQELERIKHTSSHPEGALVFVEGQDARGVYIVCQGRAKMMTTNREGRTLILKIVGPGEILGLHSVISGRPHEVTVETLQPSQLAYISREDFVRFLKTHGDACLHAAQHLSRDCQGAYTSIRSIGLSHSVTEKLARLILQWVAGAQPVDGLIRTKLTLTHEEIAQLIGTTRETVTRILGDLKKRHIAELKGATLLVRNRAALERLVSA
jgi:CRP/FNR family cyclic AMP-dependent transcriptional regulator